MSQPQADARNAQTRIGKQVMLPWSKAVEIAMKSIKVRFWRSMITMSSIILAIAFLMSIWTSAAVTASLASAPQRRIDAVKEELRIVRDAIAAVQGARPRADVEQLYAGDVAAARERTNDSIRDHREALETALGEEKAKLNTEIARLEATLDPAKSLELLRDYLADERRGLEKTKGELDATLQQERVGSEAEETDAAAPEGAAKPTRAAAGGITPDFLRQMSPTDKWLAILALLVCFVGIVNAMFMTVQERFREIGTMKCLGALDAFIVKIFLIESAALGFVGTLFGISVGLILSVVRQWLVYGRPVFTYFPLVNIVVAGAMAAVVGLVLSILAAIFPARNAARMEPVEAMRIEE